MINGSSLLLNSLPFMLQGAFMTLKIALVSIAIGLCGGTVLGVLNSQRLRGWWSYCFHAFVAVTRGTPLFVQLLIVYYALPEFLGVSLSAFAAGVITLGLNSTAYISESVRGGINAIPDGQWDAAYALGLSRFTTFKGIIIPQMLRSALPSITNELTALVKETSILMVIGVGELTKVSKDIVVRELDPMTIYIAAAGFYFVMTSTIPLIAKLLHKRYQL
jgi:polar amino acid transport system permease protein